MDKELDLAVTCYGKVKPLKYDLVHAIHEFGEEDRGIDRAFVFVLDIRIVRERVVRLDTTPAVDDLTPVSYTHLDVYKRQRSIWLIWR